MFYIESDNKSLGSGLSDLDNVENVHDLFGEIDIYESLCENAYEYEDDFFDALSRCESVKNHIQYGYELENHRLMAELNEAIKTVLSPVKVTYQIDDMNEEILVISEAELNAYYDLMSEAATWYLRDYIDSKK